MPGPSTRWSKPTVALFEALFRPWMRRRLTGLHIAGIPRSLPHDRPILIVANHVSWWDGFVLREVQRLIRPRAPLYTTMTTANLRRFFGLRLMGSVDIGRGSPAGLRRALRFLETERARTPDLTTIVFPQGTLWPARRRPLEFHRGVSAFARALAPVTILPVAIDYENFAYPSPIAFVSVGEPIEYSLSDDISADASVERLEEAVTGELDAIASYLDTYGDDAMESWPSPEGRLPHPEPEERVVIVDASDTAVRTSPKLLAHVSGDLHRGVSVLVTDGAGSVLLQQRAFTKYHSGGLWSNTCCGHPRPGESTETAAARRLDDEMGMKCVLEPAGSFYYRAELANGLTEHEIDHLFVARWTGEPNPNRSEVADWRWMEFAKLRRDIWDNPSRYTAWLGSVIEHAARHPLFAASDASQPHAAEVAALINGRRTPPRPELADRPTLT